MAIHSLSVIDPQSRQKGFRSFQGVVCGPKNNNKYK